MLAKVLIRAKKQLKNTRCTLQKITGFLINILDWQVFNLLKVSSSLRTLPGVVSKMYSFLIKTPQTTVKVQRTTQVSSITFGLTLNCRTCLSVQNKRNTANILSPFSVHLIVIERTDLSDKTSQSTSDMLKKCLCLPDKKKVAT